MFSFELQIINCSRAVSIEPSGKNIDNIVLIYYYVNRIMEVCYEQKSKRFKGGDKT